MGEGEGIAFNTRRCSRGILLDHFPRPIQGCASDISLVAPHSTNPASPPQKVGSSLAKKPPNSAGVQGRGCSAAQLEGGRRFSWIESKFASIDGSGQLAAFSDTLSIFGIRSWAAVTNELEATMSVEAAALFLIDALASCALNVQGSVRGPWPRTSPKRLKSQTLSCLSAVDLSLLVLSSVGAP